VVVRNALVKINAADFLAGLEAELKNRSYRPGPVFFVWIDEDDGKQRASGVRPGSEPPQQGKFRSSEFNDSQSKESVTDACREASRKARPKSARPAATKMNIIA